LSLVQHITLAHGGHVEVESAPGRGSKFTLTLPLTGPQAGTSAA
jgi:signal transduction histidine kinase